MSRRRFAVFVLHERAGRDTNRAVWDHDDVALLYFSVWYLNKEQHGNMAQVSKAMYVYLTYATQLPCMNSVLKRCK